MKKILGLLCCLLLVSCVKNPLKNNDIVVSKIPNCQSVEASFLEQAQKMAEEIGENIWVVDMEVFYSPKIQTCIGKYMVSRKEGGSEDMSLFVIKNIVKNEDIYFQKYTAEDLKNEHE